MNIGVGDTVYYGSNKNSMLGKIKYMRNGGNTYGDCSIISVDNSSFTHSGQVYTDTGKAYVNGTLDPAVGATVCKYGKSSGYSYGTILEKNTSVSSTYFDGSTRGITICTSNKNPQPGDSGGAVFVKSGPYVKICGIFNGGATSGPATMFYTPVYYVTSQGFTVKTVTN